MPSLFYRRALVAATPAAPTQTPARWLTHSLAWTAGCVGAWLLLYRAFPAIGPPKIGPAAWLCVGGFWLAHGLIWRKAVAGGRFLVWSPVAEASLLNTISSLWLGALFVFQLLAFVIGLAATGLALVLANYPD